MYHPRFLGTGPDSTIQMCRSSEPELLTSRTPPEITRSPFLQIAWPIAKEKEPSAGVVSLSKSFPKRSVNFPLPPARSASPELPLEKANALPPRAMKSARTATAIAGEGCGILSFIWRPPSIRASLR